MSRILCSASLRQRHRIEAAVRGAVPVMLTAAALSAQADVPACNDVVDDPTIPTCTCTCEANSQFPGCDALEAGVAAPTPDQCPDMLQGRRVLSRGDVLLAIDPVNSGGNPTGSVAQSYIYKGTDDTSNPGLAVINGTPAVRDGPSLPCRMGDTPFAMQSLFARLFALDHDMQVTLWPSGSPNDVAGNCSATSASAKNLKFVIESRKDDDLKVPPSYFNSNPQWLQLVAEDFNYDGFDDLVVLNIESFQVWSAVDPQDPTKGVNRFAALSTKNGSLRAAPMNDLTTGDFNGDGIVDVAWIGGNHPNHSGDLSVFFASVCPGPVTDTICDGAAAFDVILDPASVQFPGSTSTIVLDNASLEDTACGVVRSGGAPTTSAVDARRAGAVALGNFEPGGLNPLGAPVDELVVTYVRGSGEPETCEVAAQYFVFETPAPGQPGWAVQRGNTVTNLAGLSPDAGPAAEGLRLTYTLYAQAAALDWYGTVEHAVLGVNYNDSKFASVWYPVVLSVLGTGGAAELSSCRADDSSDTEKFPFIWGITVGRFSQSTDINPDNPSACSDFESANPGDCPYNPQIALLMANDDGKGGKEPAVQLYSVQVAQPDGSDDALKCAFQKKHEGLIALESSATKIEDSVTNNSFLRMPVASLRGGSRLRSGDAYGESVRLGPPIVARISNHTAPFAVIQTPPSHVDYVQPSPDQNVPAPGIVDFTLAPNNYFVQFALDTSSEATASRQRVRSYTTTYTEDLGIELKFPKDEVETLDIKNKESFQQFHESHNSEELGTYQTQRLNTRVKVGEDDMVWWTQTTNNLFHFPMLGVTTCPDTILCDPDDPSTTGCTEAASELELTCTASGDGCHCLNDSAAAGMCPATPVSTGDRACAEQSGEACCSLLQPQSYVTFSGPTEVVEAVIPGGELEWYQPEHEPAQVLSYPSSLSLMAAREQNVQQLAQLDEFSTAANAPTQTMGWTCATKSSVSTGSTARHSFETDTSITAGTNELAKEVSGAEFSAGFDYQSSGSISQLNTQTYGQTASSEITLSLEDAGFLDPAQYAYSIEGMVRGEVKPPSVLDNPPTKVCPSTDADCDLVDETQADCATTGPITVAFSADPTKKSDSWWLTKSPYISAIDVALNNPSRWLRTGASDVANATLQCRGAANVPICYRQHTPPASTDAASVWDANFYDMRGFLVTNKSVDGPQRDTARVGDKIYLQARVYNYSLLTMDEGTRVYARFYRQQIDVNNVGSELALVDYASDANGNPLAAVPIGPDGLGDPDPISIFTPLDGSSRIPPFNTSAQPRADNMVVAATAYDAAPGDECEYDAGTQECDGGYFVYWVTVWAEDAAGNVLGEVEGHGLDSGFDPDRLYGFITDVPLETVSYAGSSTSFSNNVAMYKKAFVILPESNTNVLTGVADAEPQGPGALYLDQLNVDSSTAHLYQPVVVAAQVTSPGVKVSSATVLLSDGDPDFGGKVIDAEWLPHIRSEDRHVVRTTYVPESCGTHDLFMEVVGGSGAEGEIGHVQVEVDIDLDATLAFLRSETRALELRFPGNAGKAIRQKMLRTLRRADWAFAAGKTEEGAFQLWRYKKYVETLDRFNRIDSAEANLLIGQVNEVRSCV